MADTFDGIEQSRITSMSDQELRWLDNIKKAFYNSDMARKQGRLKDDGFPEMFKAIDTAKTLRRSLRGESTDHVENRKRFIEFIGLEIPCFRADAEAILLFHRDKKKNVEVNFSQLIYEIRCKIHENENLNAAEAVDYHVLLDWSTQNTFAVVSKEDKMHLNAFFVWSRFRQTMAKFLTVIEMYQRLGRGESSFEVTINPALGSICPERKLK